MLFDKRLTAFQNVKADVLKKNISIGRWGNKFKKLYVPYKDENNNFDFTVGMLNCVGIDITETIEELNMLRGALDTLCQLSDVTYARDSSFFSLLVRKNYSENPTIKDIKVSISLSEAMSISDKRSRSIFLQRDTLVNEATAYLEPLLSYYTRKDIVEENLYTGVLKSSSLSAEKSFSSRNPFSVSDMAGNVYGYVDDTNIFPSVTFDTIQDTLGVEDLGNPLFLEKSEYEARFRALMQSLEPYLIKFLSVSFVLENLPTNKDVTIVYPINSLDFWLKEIQDSFLAHYYSLGQRGEVELDLIEHLGICDTLKEEIGDNAGEISKIWFEFKKNVSQVDLDPYNPYAGYDPNYAWWEEKQFDEIRKKVKNFKDYFDYIPGSRAALKRGSTKSVVVLKVGMLEQLSGHKIFWLVSDFLNMDSRTKERSFLEKLFSFALLVLAIYLVVITQNPVWLKILMIGTIVLSHTGALSPQAQLIASVIAFAYGAYSTDFSSISGLEALQFALENIDVVLESIEMYKNKEDNMENKNNEVDEYDKQSGIMKFIYEDSYDSFAIYESLISVSVEN